MTIRLSVSNLAWADAVKGEALARLAALGVQGVEVAPTRIADWDELTPARLRGYRQELEAAGLRASSLQAVFFNRPDAHLLGDEAGFAAMLEHTRKIADIGAELGAGVAVFGAPRNRLRGDRAPEDAKALAAERLRILGDAVAGAELFLGMEPVPPVYGGDFLTTADEVIDMVLATDHPWVRVHLDTGCVKLAGDRIGEAVRKALPLLVHFHAAEPQLGTFGTPQSDHAAAAAALREAGYGRWIAIEMREPPADALAEVETAVRFVQRTYG